MGPWARLVIPCVVVTCLGTPNATFELDVPTALSKEAAWYEIGAFVNGCPPDAVLLGGIPQQGAYGRLAFPASSKNAPGLGQIPSQTYGIAAVARAADCSVIGTGCASLGVNGSGTLAVSLSAVSGQPEGACVTGSVCEEAECVPSDMDAGVASNPSAGEACTLQLIGQGPLGDPLGADATLLSAPAIAATEAGFLIAYREYDAEAGVARLTTIAIDGTGATTSLLRIPLGEACTGSPQTDGTALTFAGTAGTIALSRPACPDAGEGGSGGGLVLFTVDATGSAGQGEFTTAAGENLALGQAHALATTPDGPMLAYTDPMTHASSAAVISGTSIAMSRPAIPFKLFGADSDSAAYVVGSGDGTALLALESSAADGASSADLASDPSGGMLGLGSTFPATWTSASASGNRVLVLTDSTSSTGSLAWSAFDMGTRAAVHTGTFGPAAGGNVSYADVAMTGDHAFVAAEVGHDISLFGFDRASTLPNLLGEVAFATLPVIPVGVLRDGLVAVAASDTRIAVVWGTGATLGPDDSVGGYAVFTCAP